MAVIATGFFDGVHLGHQAVVHRLSELARERGEEAVVVTFWPHPRMVMQNDARGLHLLTSSSERTALLRSAGADRVEELPFTRSFAAMTAREYIGDILVPRFGCTALLMGYDNRIGSDFADVESVRAMHLPGVETAVCPAVGEVSSTRIRKALSDGDIGAASSMLGYDYFLNGAVVSGNRLGRTLGFPTANMSLYEPLKMIPANGVYLVRVELPSEEPSAPSVSKPLYGMCNIGSRPTVNPGRDITVETNIFNFDSEIYGLPLKISFLRRLRPEKCFSSTEALREQLCSDRDRCLELLSGM